MAKTPSTMLKLGTPLPAFSLTDAVTGGEFSNAQATGKATLVMFICNHCPFVKHVMDELGRLGNAYAGKGVSVFAINSNDVAAHPDDAPEHMKSLAESREWRFPFLFDESQETAKAFHAACTPDFFVFDANRKLAYRGQLDDSRPGNGVEVSGRDLRAALDAVLSGGPAPEEQRPSVGCNIKWKADNAPVYFG
jgi:thiol-disulfide isomerase/thioredoxin